jgi:hypothetical protein
MSHSTRLLMYSSYYLNSLSVKSPGLMHAYAHRPVVWQSDGFERRG